jgi:hypothetical protein
MNAMGWVSRHRSPDSATYVLEDRLHRHPAVRVTADQITATVSTWLAHLDAHSSLAEDFARSIRQGDWAAAYAIAEALSVDVTVAA